MENRQTEIESNKSEREIRRAIRKKNLVKTIHKNHVYYVNNSLIAKVGANNEFVEKEYDIGNYLFENGIHVPKMHSMIEFDLSWLHQQIGRDNISNLILLMQRIPGHNLFWSNEVGGPFSWSEESYGKAIQLMNEELDKAYMLGVIPDDEGASNAIFNPENGKTYLIDFEYWKWA